VDHIIAEGYGKNMVFCVAKVAKVLCKISSSPLCIVLGIIMMAKVPPWVGKSCFICIGSISKNS